MRLFHLFRTQIRCSAAMAALLPLAAICGALPALLTVLLALLPHEAGHLLMASRLGYRIKSIEIQPYGFVMQLAGSFTLPGDELAVAAAGPVMSLVTAAGCQALCSKGLGGPFLTEYARASFLLACVNLMPAGTLDGGRALTAALQKRRPERAAVLSGCSGLLASALLIACGVWGCKKGNVPLPLFLFGAFLMLSSIRAICASRRIPGEAKRQLSFFAARRSGGGVPLRPIAVESELAASEALRLCGGGRMALLVVLDRRGRVLGQLPEAYLLEAIAAQGGNITLREILRQD